MLQMPSDIRVFILIMTRLSVTLMTNRHCYCHNSLVYESSILDSVSREEIHHILFKSTIQMHIGTWNLSKQNNIEQLRLRQQLPCQR